MSRALKVKLFPSQEIKASKNIQCLQSSSGNHRFQYGKRTMMRNFHSTVAKFEDIHRNESKVTTPPSSDPTVNARLLDNVIIIENDLSSLIKEEVKEIKENFKQSVAKLHSQFLSPSFSVSFFFFNFFILVIIFFTFLFNNYLIIIFIYLFGIK